ncbi:Receptor-interacting serine/threonine-protein kinase 1 [Holothuria leucospilota]|uniref:Receptor-interacting serine/threonine-protein kinase 1 n=1 Tax=Holothuria leucospilota TaxID=206669 RepID=A0A9Q1CS76_HOLLE|nr:Receptor-interacting serine/threonine-protein kinase 1 [Holothuria leucospilota]
MAHFDGDSSKNPVPNSILLDLSRKITGEWKNIARCLELSEGTINHISVDQSNNVQEQIYQMLVSWKQSKGQLATYGVLSQALRQASRHDLADNLISCHGHVTTYSDQNRQELPSSLSKEKAFRSVLVDVARMLRKKDVRWMVFQCPQIPPSDQESIEDAVRLFDEMKRYGILSVERLEDLLGKLNLTEPLSVLQDFKRRHDGCK